MRGLLLRTALVTAAAGAALVVLPPAAAAQGSTPITFTLTIAGPYPGQDGFAVHIEMPVVPQDRVLCVAPGSGSGPVCASGRTYSVVYEASEWPTHPYRYERIRSGTVAQTFLGGSVFVGRPETVRATFTYAGANAPAPPVPATGRAAASGAGIGVGLILAGSLLVTGSRGRRPAAAGEAPRTWRDR